MARRACVVLGAVVWLGSGAPGVAADLVPTGIASSPEWVVPQLLNDGKFEVVDAMVETFAASGERDQDGQFQLYMVTKGMHDSFEALTEQFDKIYAGMFEQWKSQAPKSAFAPIAEAMQRHAAAWRARGRGLSSSVTAEGEALFHERSTEAWTLIMAARDRSSRLPCWYEIAIWFGSDADAPQDQLDALFKEALHRFPAYYPVYFAYVRQFAPRWGGDYQSADKFIRAQVASKSNLMGDALYARLYWQIDHYAGQDQDFFTTSSVSWARMKKGFEELMAAYPRGTWNQATFTAFACRKGDAATYINLRRRVDVAQFRRAAPEGYSLEVCDARFTQRT